MIRVTSVLFWFTLVIAASVALYHTSYRVHELGKQLHDLNASIESEQRNIHVLKADWVYLSNPARVEHMAQRHLSLHPTIMKQIASMDAMATLLPIHNGSLATNTKTEPMTKIAVVVPTPAPVKLANATRSIHVTSTDDRSHINTRMIIEHSTQAASHPVVGPIILASFGSHP